jgi:uncharacterized protein YbjT (DUF2867 family)
MLAGRFTVSSTWLMWAFGHYVVDIPAAATYTATYTAMSAMGALLRADGATERVVLPGRTEIGHNGSMTRIAIIGGHGKVALKLSPILAAEGHDVTSIIRNPDHQADVAATGATPLVLDVEQASTAEIADALRDHDAVVWSAGAGGGNPQRTYAVDRDAAIRSMDAAGQAGAGRYVMVSYLGSRPDHGVPADDPFFAYAEAKAAADSYLSGTSLDWTILGPGRLTDGPGTGLIDVHPDGSWQSADTSRANVALVAAAALKIPSTTGRRIEFRDGATPIETALEAAA